MRLRTLTEAECYVRCYGRDEESVSVVRVDPGRVSRMLSGEAVRRLFEERIDTRDPDLQPEAA